MASHRPARWISPLLLWAAGCAETARDVGPNVLLISIDTLRPDHLHCYGYERETSPRIDSLAAAGVLFENHVSSSSWTLPAHAAMFTSLDDAVHGCIDVKSTALAPEFVTLAERFRQAGYATAGFFSGPYLHPAFGLDQGFGTYADCTAVARELRGREREDWVWDEEVMRASHRDVSNPRVYATARDWLRSKKAGSFFAFVHFWDVHFDFTPPAPFDTAFDPDYEGPVTGEDFYFDDKLYNPLMEPRDLEHLLALYDGEILWTDYYVGKLLDDLANWGVDEDTLVVVTSDHGTEFFEHGWKAHRSSLFDEQIRIPLVLRFPGRLEAGRRVVEQTRMVDLGPTLLELAGLPPAEGVSGSSLVPLARGEPAGFESTAISELWSRTARLRSVRTPRYKFIQDLGRDGFDWFHLGQDPRELEPLQRVKDGLGAQAAANYVRAVEGLERRVAQRPASPAEPDLMGPLVEQLQRFGYVGKDEEEDE